MSVTLGNLLDNAVEACKKISAPEDKYINISITTSKTALVINIQNSKSRDLNNDLKTDKSDNVLHGYGLSNVVAIADKYGGTFDIVNKESSFETTVVLPLRDE